MTDTLEDLPIIALHNHQIIARFRYVSDAACFVLDSASRMTIRCEINNLVLWETAPDQVGPPERTGSGWSAIYNLMNSRMRTGAPV